ncbi:hypothetical protein LCGC14_1111170 [marine sediment metagenome]|uniref:Uncharacterized protein n=1 Tax=marine sediment metagenome TaxID=412755 RepID=A0A0F9M6K8_9ZZZZ
MPLSEEEEAEKIKATVKEILRTAGIVCFDMDDATGPELEEIIQGGG